MNTDMKEIFSRQELLLGGDVMERIASLRVIIFGVGGVGSWCAESLVRSGVQHMTIVDSDIVCITNVNRQLMATTATVGQVKVEVMRQRLLEINPEAEVKAIRDVYSEENADRYDLDSYDYVIDAIDSLRDKACLILRATASKAAFFSSMGAALKMDPTKIDIAEFWKVRGCPLAAALRRKFKHSKTFPSRKFKCVYSEELLSNHGDEETAVGCATCGSDSAYQAGSTVKARVNGTIAHTTAIFGLMLAGLVMQDVYSQFEVRE